MVQVGIEGPGHYGAGPARYLRAEGIHVTEVGRPKRQRSARYGKSVDADAAGAAAIVLAGEDLGDPKTADGPAEMVRVLRGGPVQCGRRLQESLLGAQGSDRHCPDELRAELSGCYRKTLLYACRTLAIPEIPCTPTDTVKIALKRRIAVVI